MRKVIVLVKSVTAPARRDATTGTRIRSRAAPRDRARSLRYARPGRPAATVLVAVAALLALPLEAQAQTAPTVTGIALTSTPVYGFDRDIYSYGNEVEATVTFSAAVDITGTPQLELDFAGTAKAAACATGTNTTTMVCSYTVERGDSAPDGIAIAANKLTGDMIYATGSTITADLTHVAVDIDAGHKVDGIPPTLITTAPDEPTTSPDGTEVILTFSEDIRRVNRNLITIEADGATLSTTAADRTGNKAEITLATALTAAATNITVTLRSNAVSDDFGNGIRAVAASVINAVTPPPPAPPPEELKARRGDGEVRLEWVPGEAYATDPDLAYQLRYGPEGGELSQWEDIPRSAPGGRNARSYTVTGLENGTRYAFELRLRRESGVGEEEAEIRQTPQAPRWSVSTNRRSVHEGEDVTLGIATSNAVGFYSAPEALTLAVIGQIEFGSTTIEGADPEDYEIRVAGNKVRGIHEGHHVPQLRRRFPRAALRPGGAGRFNFPGRDREGACRRPGGGPGDDVVHGVPRGGVGEQRPSIRYDRCEHRVIRRRRRKAARGGRRRGDGGRGPVAGLRGDARAGGGMDGDRGLCDP